MQLHCYYENKYAIKRERERESEYEENTNNKLLLLQLKTATTVECERGCVRVLVG